MSRKSFLLIIEVKFQAVCIATGKRYTDYLLWCMERFQSMIIISIDTCVDHSVLYLCVDRDLTRRQNSTRLRYGCSRDEAVCGSSASSRRGMPRSAVPSSVWNVVPWRR